MRTTRLGARRGVVWARRRRHGAQCRVDRRPCRSERLRIELDVPCVVVFDAVQHEAVATGSLFWAMDRTSKDEVANMSLVMCTVYIPEVKVHVPGQPQHTARLPKDGGMPAIPILKNPRPLKKHVRLIAMEDPVVAEVTKADQKRLREERLAEVQAKKVAKTK